MFISTASDPDNKVVVNKTVIYTYYTHLYHMTNANYYNPKLLYTVLDLSTTDRMKG